MTHLLSVGIGPLGQRLLADFHTRGLGQVVAAVDPAPELAGRDLSEIAEGLPAGVPIVSSLEEVQDWDAIRCAVVTTRSGLEDCMETFRHLLARGKSVVSTCEELAWPWLRHPILAQELDQLAIRNDGRLLGTGVNPGFLMDVLPVVASTLCENVSSIRVERIQDASPRRLPFQRKIGATLAPEEFEQRVQAGSLRHVGLGESLHFLAHYLGLPIDRWEETIEPVIAEHELDCGVGRVRKGHAAGVRQVARAWHTAETPSVELVFQASIGEPEPRDAVHIQGNPPLELVLPGGVHGDVATSAVVLNSIRPLLAAPHGLHNMCSLPLQGCAPPFDFSSR